MPRFLLHHRHEPRECSVVFAAFNGHDGPPGLRAALASCRPGGHEIWWTVTAASEVAALAQLPVYVAARTTATAVEEVEFA
jgi:hypothetical protein